MKTEERDKIPCQKEKKKIKSAEGNYLDLIICRKEGGLITVS